MAAPAPDDVRLPDPPAGPSVVAAPEPTALRLELRGVGRKFASTWVLRDVDVDLAGPGVVGLVGENGAGKTSLLRIVAQLLEPSEGEVILAGRAFGREADGRSRARVGIAPHRPLAWPAESVRSNLRYAARLAGMSRTAARSRAAASIEAWSLQDRATTAVGALSRGWQQRYALARADIASAELLLLDEPTSGLDDAGRELLDATLARWRRDRLVLVATHERAWIATYAETLVALAPPAEGGR